MTRGQKPWSKGRAAAWKPQGNGNGDSSVRYWQGSWSVSPRNQSNRYDKVQIEQAGPQGWTSRPWRQLDSDAPFGGFDFREYRGDECGAAGPYYGPQGRHSSAPLARGQGAEATSVDEVASRSAGQLCEAEAAVRGGHRSHQQGDGPGRGRWCGGCWGV